MNLLEVNQLLNSLNLDRTANKDLIEFYSAKRIELIRALTLKIDLIVKQAFEAQNV